MPSDDACVQPDKSRKVDVGFVLYVFVHSEGRFPQVSQALLEHLPARVIRRFPAGFHRFPAGFRSCMRWKPGFPALWAYGAQVVLKNKTNFGPGF